LIPTYLCEFFLFDPNETNSAQMQSQTTDRLKGEVHQNYMNEGSFDDLVYYASEQMTHLLPSDHHGSFMIRTKHHSFIDMSKLKIDACVGNVVVHALISLFSDTHRAETVYYGTQEALVQRDEKDRYKTWADHSDNSNYRIRYCFGETQLIDPKLYPNKEALRAAVEQVYALQVDN
jgi:hypothetical protein